MTESEQLNTDAAPLRSRSLSVALAGVPNAGKTTLFNALTGLNYKVANYPGVTVERKTGKAKIPGIKDVLITDLPGTYSLNGGAPEETIAAQYLSGLINETPPDLVVCVVDACNLERNLFLASQLIDSGYPVIVALSMLDEAVKRGIVIRKEILSRELGVPVVDIAARQKAGVDGLAKALLNKARPAEKRFTWSDQPSYIEFARQVGQTHVQSHKVPIHPNVDLALIGMGLIVGAWKANDEATQTKISETRAKLSDQGIDFNNFEAEKRYLWIEGVLARSVSIEDPKRKNITETIDKLATHRIFGLVFFAAIMFFMFESVFSWASAPMDFIDQNFSAVRNWIIETFDESALRSLVADGIVAGAGSVLIFIPQIAILFFLISMLEETGYLARAAFLMDRVMRKVGLQGRSFIPMLNSFACAVPGIMSTRTIPSFADRMVTIMVAPLMSCSARLPVYALLIAAFVPAIKVWGVFSLQGIVFFSMYLLGVIGAAIAALIFKATLFKGLPSHFVMEMPPYRMPQFKNVFRSVIERVLIFLKDAGTVIMACSIVLWFLASFPKVEAKTQAEAVRGSYAGQLGTFIEPVIRPLGYDWKIGVSLIASFAAREVFVSSIALVNNLEEADETSESLISAIREAKDSRTGERSYNLVTALSLMVFYVFACQCMSTLAVVWKETGSIRWPVVMFVYMTLMAYGAAFITYQIGNRLL